MNGAAPARCQRAEQIPVIGCDALQALHEGALPAEIPGLARVGAGASFALRTRRCRGALPTCPFAGFHRATEVTLDLAALRTHAARELSHAELETRFDGAERSARLGRNFAMAQTIEERKLQRFALEIR